MALPGWADWTLAAVSAFTGALAALGVAFVDSLEPWRVHLLVAAAAMFLLSFVFAARALGQSPLRPWLIWLLRSGRKSTAPAIDFQAVAQELARAGNADASQKTIHGAGDLRPSVTHERVQEIAHIISSLTPPMRETVRKLSSGEPRQVQLANNDNRVLVRELRYVEVKARLGGGLVIAVLRPEIASAAQLYFQARSLVERAWEVSNLTSDEQEFLRLLCRSASEFEGDLEAPPMIEPKLYAAAVSLVRKDVAAILPMEAQSKEEFILFDDRLRGMIEEKIGCTLQRTAMTLRWSQIPGTGATGGGATSA